MGGVLTKKKNLQSSYNFWVRGLEGSGKSSVIYRLNTGEVCTDEEYLEYDLETFTTEHKGQNIHAREFYLSRSSMRIVDKMAHRYLKHVDSVVYVVDSSKPDDVTNSVNDLNTYYFQDEFLQDKLLMVLANKQDLENAVCAQELEDKIKKTCKLGFGISVFVMPTSVKTGEGLDLAFYYFWNLLILKKEKLLKPGLLPRAWEMAEKQMSSDNFDEVTVISRKELDERSMKKKNHMLEAMKCILNY